MRNPTRKKDGDLRERLRATLLGADKAVPTSGLSRLWRTGRGLGGLLLGSRDLDEQQLTRLVGSLGELKGIAMKAGQMLGYVDQSLPPELRAALSLLQTAAPTTPLAKIQQIVAESGAPVTQLGAQPVAVASIGQVHRGLFDERDVAVKVRHPGIEKAVAADFRSAKIGSAMASLMGGASVPDLIDEARTAFLEECDFALEGRRQERFRALFAADPVIAIPAVKWASPSVLVTRWMPGRSLDELLSQEPSQGERDRLGAAMFRFWMRALYQEGLFHGDPHPGNFAFTDEGRLVIYDFGCVREFDAGFRRAFGRLAAATRADDLDAMSRAFEELGGRPSEKRRPDLRRWLRGFFGPLLQPGSRPIAPDEGVDARQVMRDKRALLALHPPGKMLFLFRLRFGLYAVLSRLGAACDWSSLESAWAD